MRPLEGVSYSRLSPAADQARAAPGYLVAGHYSRRNDPMVGVQAVLDDLVFDLERTCRAGRYPSWAPPSSSKSPR
jgi:hypothetical protein